MTAPRTRPGFRFLLATAVAACLGADAAASRAASIEARHAAVASEHRLASGAGVEILRRGGNAVDAAVAAALATGVVNPSSSGLGGGGFLVVWDARRARAATIDFRESAPRGAARDMYLRADGSVDAEASRTGALAVAVPGEPRGLALALARHGTMTFAEVAAPAIRIAREGFAIEGHLAAQIASQRARLAADAELARVFLHADGSPRAEGETLRRPQLAATLERLASAGVEDFYVGEIAADIARTVASSHARAADQATRPATAAPSQPAGAAHPASTATGATTSASTSAPAPAATPLDAADLAAYRPLEREPLRLRYRGRDIVAMAPPSSGGGVLGEALALLERWDVARLDPLGPTWAHLAGETMKAVFADRAQWYGDPAFADVPLPRLLGREHLAALGARLDFRRAVPAAEFAVEADAPRGGGTSHICVVDARGNAAALTTSVNTSFGAGLSVPGRDIVLNNTMDDFSAAPGKPNAFGLVGSEANAVAAGKRPLSSMTPVVVLRGRSVELVAGGSGGPLILTGTLQVLVGVVDFGRTSEAAVVAPRVHHQWMPDRLFLEAAFPEKTRRDLRGVGHAVADLSAKASIQAIRVTGTGEQRLLQATSDPRKGGVPAGW